MQRYSAPRRGDVAVEGNMWSGWRPDAARDVLAMATIPEMQLRRRSNSNSSLCRRARGGSIESADDMDLGLLTEIFDDFHEENHIVNHVPDEIEGEVASDDPLDRLMMEDEDPGTQLSPFPPFPRRAYGPHAVSSDSSSVSVSTTDSDTEAHSAAMVAMTSSPSFSDSNSETSSVHWQCVPKGNVDRKTRRRQQVASSARRHRARKKSELLELRDQVHSLRLEFEELRLHRKHSQTTSPGMAAWEDFTISEKLRRQHSEQLNADLRRAVLEQSFFVSKLQSVLSCAPNGMFDLNYTRMMHTHLSLGHHPMGRARDLESMFAKPKVQLALDMLTRNTSGMRTTDHVMSVQVVEEPPHAFGTTVVSVSAFDTLDLLRVFHHAREAIWMGSNAWPGFCIPEAKFTVSYARKDQSLVYGTQRSRYRWQDEKNQAQDMWLEMPLATYVEIHKEHAIMLWDFVDEDSLLPVDPDTDVHRQAIGGFVVRREMCEDCKERVVFRMIASKMHTIRHDSVAAVGKFETSVRGDIRLMCAQVIYNNIFQAVMHR